MISVIIPTYNRCDLLLRAINSLGRQDLDQGQFEIIIVDDGSTDGTEAAVRQLTAVMPDLRYLKQENRGPAAARNLGINNARGDIIAFIDSDAVADREWLKNAAAYFRDQKVAALEGKIMLPPNSDLTLFSHYFENISGGLYQTCNMFFRRQVLVEAGGFDMRFQGDNFFREDSDLIFTLIDKGMVPEKIPFAPDAAVYHPPRKERPGTVITRAKRYQWDPLLYKKHPGLYKKYIGGVIDGGTLLILLSTILLLSPLAKFALLALLIIYAVEIGKQLPGKKFNLTDVLIFIAVSLPVPFVKFAYLSKGIYTHRKFLW